MSIPDLLFESTIKGGKVQFFFFPEMSLSLHEFQLLTLGSPWLGLSNTYCLEFKIQLWGNSLATQCLGLCSHCQGPRLEPWSGNWDPTSLTVWPKYILLWGCCDKSLSTAFPTGRLHFPLTVSLCKAHPLAPWAETWLLHYTLWSRAVFISNFSKL